MIQKYQSVFDTEEARQVTFELRAKYPRRRTMLELLDNLENSWKKHIKSAEGHISFAPRIPPVSFA